MDVKTNYINDSHGCEKSLPLILLICALIPRLFLTEVVLVTYHCEQARFWPPSGYIVAVTGGDVLSLMV